MQAGTSLPSPGLRPILADASVQLREEESGHRAVSLERNRDSALDRRGSPSAWNVEDVAEEWEALQARLREDLVAQEKLMKLLIQQRRDDEQLSAARRADDVASQKIEESRPPGDVPPVSLQSSPPKVSAQPKKPTKKDELTISPGWEDEWEDPATASPNRMETFSAEKALTMVRLRLRRPAKSQASSSWQNCLASLFYDAVEWRLCLVEPQRVGRLARLADSGSFEALCISMVLLNVLFTVHQQNTALQDIGGELPGTFAVVDWMFTSFFLLELALKLAVHGLYFFVVEDAGWNILDFVVVVMTTWQLIMSSIGSSGMSSLGFLRSFRILKLARILRLVRMIKIFDDLRIIVAAFINSVVALGWCLLLLFLTVGIFAMLFVQLVEDFLTQHQADLCTSPAEECISNMLMHNFGSVQRSILTLYMATTGGNDWAYYYEMLSQTGESASAIFIFYTTFYYFGMFNLLTGMFVDKAVRASKPDADAIHLAARQMEEDFVKGFLGIFEEFDHDGDKLIDRAEFQEVVYGEKGKAYMLGMSLDPGAMRVVFDSLEAISPKVHVEEFIRGCCRMRGEAKSMDLHSLRYEVQDLREHLDAGLAAMDRHVLSLGRQRGNTSDGEEFAL